MHCHWEESVIDVNRSKFQGSQIIFFVRFESCYACCRQSYHTSLEQSSGNINAVSRSHPLWLCMVFVTGKEISVDMSVEADWRVSQCGWKTGPCLPPAMCILSSRPLWTTLEGGWRWRTHSLQQQEQEEEEQEQEQEQEEEEEEEQEEEEEEEKEEEEEVGGSAANNRRSALAP